MRNKFKIKINLNKYQKLTIFFFSLMFILWIRLFYLQVIKADEYKNLLFSQHYSVSDLEPERGNIYLENKNSEKIPLTENIDLYELYADPYVIWNRKKLSELLGPIVYKHFCDRYKLDKVDKLECIKNIEKWSGQKIIKEENNDTTVLLTGDLKNTKLEKNNINLSYITTGTLQTIVNNHLAKLFKKNYITKAYISFIDDVNIIKKLKKIQGIIIQDNNYVYVDLDNIGNFDNTVSKLYNLLNNKYKNITLAYLQKILHKRPKRYVKIADNVNPIRINEIKKLKKKYKSNKKDRIPLFHGIGFNKQPFRYYPHNSFLSHVIGYINNNNGVGGIEEYYNDILKGKKGKIVGMNTPWIGQIASSSINIKKAQNGGDIYLTIDYTLQKKLEEIIKKYYYDLKSDNISAVVMDPFNGKIKAIAGYPNFNPNNRKDIYKIKPLKNEYKYLVDVQKMGTTYYDIPILYETGGKLKLATTKERFNPKIKKYIYKNILGPRTFINQAISSPYEPGSIFKVITEAIGIDSQIIGLYDYYEDKGKINVGPYTIKNVAKECIGYNTFLHALERSCNVGMVKIIKKIGKDIYYNYLKQLGFGGKTGIQLADESKGKISALDKFSLARFYNNSFGQGILVTPIQMAVTYSAIINGGYLLRPTIVDKIKIGDQIENIGKYTIDKVFATKISKDMIYALYSTIYNGDLKNIAIKGYTLGGKTGTSQISYKGRYQRGNGWTIGSFVGIVTKDNLKYVIAIKVVRPRTCQWGLCSAGKIYKELSKFIIEYEGIKK